MRAVSTSPTALPRQAFRYVVVGLAQLVLDSAVFVASTALGVPVPAGNVAGRIAGACLGFWLNGRWTFADGDRARLQGRHLRRFAVAWLVLTIASTLAVAQVAAFAGLQWSWLAKPFVELVLAGIGFVVMRHWVYR
jgi:putative flippase GtrA